MIFLGLFLHALRKTKTDDIPIGFELNENLAFPNGSATGTGNGHGNGHGNGNGNGHGQEPAPAPAPHEDVVTAETLNRLIRENPANMTHAIRAWLVGNNGADGAPPNPQPKQP